MDENKNFNDDAPDAVILIDGDNDPHLPPDFKVSPRSLVRVFLRTGAKMPKTLERRVGHLHNCLTVVSPKGGANAADFVMSLHAGILHATLPLAIPFTLVTFDKALLAITQELQRVGRQVGAWTSHPEGEPRRRTRLAPAAVIRKISPRRRSPAPAPPAPSPSSKPTLQEAAAAYAQRLSRLKDIPSRVKSLLNDIRFRAKTGSFSPEEILEKLKKSHGYRVDEQGKVHRP